MIMMMYYDCMNLNMIYILLIFNATFTYSILLQGYNLCYSTLVNTNDVDKLSPETYEKSPSGHVFVKATTKKGWI